MKTVSVFLCSPRVAGVTAGLANIFTAGFADKFHLNYLYLFERTILPCRGCNNCRELPFVCPLAAEDETEDLFSLFFNSGLIIFAAPIYFYGLPAHFKAFIDRAQRYWHMSSCTNINEDRKPVILIMTAGRKKGKLLFSGAMRTLNWFLKTINGHILEANLFRGMNEAEDILPDYAALLLQRGRFWATALENGDIATRQRLIINEFPVQ